METFVHSLGAYCAHLHDEAVEHYPRMASDEALCAQAMRLLHTAHLANSDSGSDEDYEAMLGAAEASVRSATATVHDIGAVHPERAAHAWPSDLPREAVAVAMRALDLWTLSQQAVIATKRTKKGTHKKVTKYGRSFADGSTRTDEVTQLVPYPLDNALANVHRGPFGADGIALAAIATSAYRLPMVGAEFESWSEVIPALTSALLAAEPYNYAAHTTGPYIGTNERQRPQYGPRYRIGYHPRDEDPTGTTSALVASCDTTARRTVIPALTERDEAGKVTTKRAERIAVRSAPPERLFVGHEATQRPPSKNRRASTKRADSYDEVFKVGADVLAGIADIAATLEPGKRGRWHDEAWTIAGTITRGKGARYSATVDGSTVKVKGARTVAALTKQLAPAIEF
jgi:hypothetical protein